MTSGFDGDGSIALQHVKEIVATMAENTKVGGFDIGDVLVAQVMDFKPVS